MSLDTSRIEMRPKGYRVHLLTHTSEPSYRPKPGGPAYDQFEMTMDVDCDAHQALNVDGVIFDSDQHPVYRESYPRAQWKDFNEADLGPGLLFDLCRVLAPRRA